MAEFQMILSADGRAGRWMLYNYGNQTLGLTTLHFGDCYNVALLNLNLEHYS